MVIFGANTIHLYNFMVALKIEHFAKLRKKNKAAAAAITSSIAQNVVMYAI